MNQEHKTKDSGAALRRRAEDSLDRETSGMADRVDLNSLSAAEIQHLVHELRVHQVELELQNEELRSAQHELAAARDRYRDLYDFAPVGYLTVSEKGLILEANLTVTRLLCVKRGALGKKRLAEFVQPSDQDRYYLGLKELFERGKSQSLKLGLLRPNSELFYAHIEAERYRSSPDAEFVCRAAVQDVTARVMASAQLRNYREHLEAMVAERTQELEAAQEQLVRQERLALLGRVARGVGNELRNPLSVIAASVYFLKAFHSEADSLTMGHLDFIDQEVENVSRIITTLEDYPQLGSPDRQLLALAPLVAAVLQEKEVPDKVAVISEVDADLPLLVADQRQIQQALEHLIANACEAMGQEGTLTVRTWQEAANGAVPPQAVIAVSDTGEGVPADHLDLLFEPLFTTKLRHIGLGLSVTKLIVEAHGGSIDVSSTVGEGSTFTVRLPLPQRI